MKALQQDIEGRWGFLPPELRQRLMQRDFQEFTPDYQDELKAYYRRIAKQ